MKTPGLSTMKGATARHVLAFTFTLLFASPVLSQTIEIDGGVGYTAVDMEAWAGVEPYDWNNMASYVNAQVLFPISATVSLGAGAGYQYLFWYDFRYLSSYITYEAEATRITGIARFHFNRNFIDLTFGTYLFEDYSNFAGGVNLGRAFRLSEKLSLPVKISTTVIVDSDAMILPITVGTGLSYKFR
jgi:hypothetical protein